jgi:Ca2+-binding RTX toxin-like protein
MSIAARTVAARRRKLIGRGGADTLDGMGGNDMISYALAADGVLVSLADPTQNTGEAAGDLLLGGKTLAGHAFLADTLIRSAAAGPDWLAGDGGDDSLVGAGGHTLDGGTGRDTISLARSAVLVSLLGPSVAVEVHALNLAAG